MLVLYYTWKVKAILYLPLQNILLQRNPLINILLEEIYFLNFIFWNIALSSLTGSEKLHSLTSPEITKCHGKEVVVNMIIKPKESAGTPQISIQAYMCLSVLNYTSNVSSILGTNPLHYALLYLGVCYILYML